jgi:hypothetical protein
MIFNVLDPALPHIQEFCRRRQTANWGISV